MSARIAFSEPPRVPAELPVYPTIPPAWNDHRLADLAERLGVRGPVVDTGNWFVVHDSVSTLQVCQASHSIRFGRDPAGIETHQNTDAALDRGQALAVAQRFHDLLG